MGLVVLALKMASVHVLVTVGAGAVAYALLLYIFKEPLLKYVPYVPR
jgi:hypothetical protein